MQQILSALAISFLVIQSSVPGGKAESGPVPHKPAFAQVWRLDAIYRDRKHGVTFRYPSVWRPSTQFGYWPPALYDSVTPPIAGFGYRVGGFPRAQNEEGHPYSATNVEGFGIVYSAFAAASAAKCTETAASLSYTANHRIATFRKNSFVVYQTGQGGMTQSASGSLYATYASRTCYLFETSLALSEGAVDNSAGISALTPAQSRFIETQLLNIVRSAQIVPKADHP
jgi:hypothetical protein